MHDAHGPIFDDSGHSSSLSSNRSIKDYSQAISWPNGLAEIPSFQARVDSVRPTVQERLAAKVGRLALAAHATHGDRSPADHNSPVPRNIRVSRNIPALDNNSSHNRLVAGCHSQQLDQKLV
jgi:hypothetical protein